MSSGKIFTTLATDSELEALGVQNVFSEYSAETIPREGLTIILRWGDEDYRRAVKTGPRDLSVWVHSPMENGTDYTQINRVLDRVKNILEPMVHEVGDDGVQVTSAEKVGGSRNLRDPGFNTITRYNRYAVLLRTVV